MTESRSADSPASPPETHSLLCVNELLERVEDGASGPAVNEEYFQLLPKSKVLPANATKRHYVLPYFGLMDLYNTRLPAGYVSRVAFDCDLIHIQLRRRGSYLSAGGDESDASLLQGVELLVSTTKAGAVSQARTTTEDDFQAIVIHLRPSLLLSKLGVKVHKLPSALQDIFRSGGSIEGYREAHYILPDRISRILDSILDTELDPTLSPIYLQAKAIESIVECINLLQTPDVLAERSGFVGKHARPFEQAQRILREHFRQPPTIDDIASAVGVSRRKLTTGFRDRYGMSLMQYALQLRMEEAQRLLKTGEFQIAQVGYRVGYQQASNFAQAYKAYFGYSPKDE